MPFLFNSKNYLIIVDQKARQGLFYQLYSSTGFSRPFQIQSFVTDCYSAVLDSSERLHVVAQNAKNQIIHYTYLEGNNSSNLLLDDSKDIYKFSNLILTELDGELHLFYTALRPNMQTYSLVHQPIGRGPSPVDHLSTYFSSTLPPKYICHDHQIDIFSLTSGNEIGYTISCITYPHSNGSALTLLHSEFPIIDFDICLVDGIYHITYIQDIYGNYQLCYTNAQMSTSLPLYASNTLGSPSILSYLGHLWISYLDNTILYTLLSMNKGENFSSPVKCSLQDNLYYYTYATTKPSSLMASHLYASVFNRIRLAIVSAIDVEQIHPDIPANTELDLLIDGLSFMSSYTPYSSPVPTPSQELMTKVAPPTHAKPFVLKETTPPPTQPIDPPVIEKLAPTTLSATSSPTSINPTLRSATKAFMNELTAFDAAPINIEEK